MGNERLEHIAAIIKTHEKGVRIKLLEEVALQSGDEIEVVFTDFGTVELSHVKKEETKI